MRTENARSASYPGFWRGAAIGVPLAILLWAGIILGVGLGLGLWIGG